MELHIIAAGMVSAVGYNVRSSSFAIKAGISALEDLPYSDETGKSLRGTKVDLPQYWEGYPKLVDLVSPAIYECLAIMPAEIQRTIPLLIGLPLNERQFYSDAECKKILSDVEQKLELVHHPDSCVICYGQVSGVKAIKQAYDLLQQGHRYCIVAGVDSYLHKKTINHYLNESRLITAKNTNGFFPGEAGSAVLVSLSPNCAKNTVCVVGLGEGYEPAFINSGTVFKAQGMTNAIRSAVDMANINLSKATVSLSDINGEHYKFEEINLALGRFSRIDAQTSVDVDMWHPIQYVGEVGAAIIPFLLGYIWALSENNHLTSEYLLLTAGNDNEDRAALIVQCC